MSSVCTKWYSRYVVLTSARQEIDERERQLPGMVESIESIQTDDAAKQALVQETFGTPYQESAESLEKYGRMVEETIDLEELDKHNCVIKPDYDPKLRELADQLSDVSGLVHPLLRDHY
jgi:hypothetical protein